MSRAFVRESDDSKDEPQPRPRPQLAPGLKNPITPAGAQRFRTELEALLESKRQLSGVAETVAFAEIEKQKRELETRIRVLQQILDSVVVTPPPAIGRDRVCFGAKVLVRDASGQGEAYRIVGLDETDPDHGHISWRSPLARALLSRGAGETILFQSPSGLLEFQIVSVTYDE